MATAELTMFELELDPHPRYELYTGHVVDVLRAMEPESVHCVVTSPPYWGLRTYGTNPQVFGGDPDCEHEWADTERSPWANALPGPNGRKKNTVATRERTKLAGQFCSKCGAWLGELGSEPSHDLYVDHMVAIFREVWRVLRNDGQLWLNLGDSYLTGAGRVRERPGGGEQGDRWVGTRAHRAQYHGKHAKVGAQIGPMLQANRMPQAGLKAKNLAGIPWRVALALQADGWILRNEVIWNKKNAMPTSAKDRLTVSHEQLFLLTKQGRYYFDRDAIREPLAAATIARDKHTRITTGKDGPYAVAHDHETPSNPKGRNKRSVWTIACRPYKGAHFATFTPDLVEPCVLAGTSQVGCCPKCGKGWERIVETYRTKDGVRRDDLPPFRNTDKSRPSGAVGDSHNRYATVTNTLGWRPACKCNAGEPVPAIVLDPFSGSATTGQVALGHGRYYRGVDLRAEYSGLGRDRLEQTLLDLVRPHRPRRRGPAKQKLPLFDLDRS